MISLKSSDGVTFEVELAVALESHTIKNMFSLDHENSAADINLTLPIEVKSNILGMVIEYCKRHANSSDDEDLKSFDSAFVQVDHNTLFSLISAANYLNIISLIDLTTQAVADMLKGKSSEEMGRILKIVNDFSPDERVRQRLNNLFPDL